MAKPIKSNLNNVVRESLTTAGYSHYLVLNAVNSALGELEVKSKGDDKTGNMKLAGKKDPKLSISVKPGTIKFETFDTVSAPLRFCAWHDGLSDALKVTTDFTVSIPPAFTSWLDKFAKTKKEDTKEETATA